MARAARTAAALGLAALGRQDLLAAAAEAVTCPPPQDPYTSEPIAFGWPLTPNDWSYTYTDCWSKKEGGHAMCSGLRQSPMDLAVTKDVEDGGYGRGALGDAAAYVDLEQKRGETSQVRISPYLRSALIEKDFGSLTLRSPTGEKVIYDAFQVHLTASSMHTVNGKHYDGEIMIFHKPRGSANMMEDGVILSAFVRKSANETSPLFSQMGFRESNTMPASTEPYWPVGGDVNVASELKKVLKGNAWFYNGSVPVPPCSETVKYFVLEDVLPVGEKQLAMLHEMLRTWAAGNQALLWRDENKRTPVERNRRIVANTLEVGGDHQDISCKAMSKEDQMRSSVCWKYMEPTCGDRSQSPVLLQASKAMEAQGMRESAADIAHYKVPPRSAAIMVQPSMYTLKAEPKAAGDWFGHLELHGRSFPVRSISVKAISSHVFADAEGARTQYAGELVLEHSLFGDRVVDIEDYPEYNPIEHTVLMTVPIKLGKENPILRQMGLGVTAFKSSVRDGQTYSPLEDIDLMTGLQKSLQGNWFWYNGSMLEPPCREGIKWLVLEEPLEASMAQLNFLALKVPGTASTRLTATQTGVDPHEYLNHLPPHAVQIDHVCPHPDTPFSYLNTHCWHHCKIGCSQTCAEGKLQSPIDIDTSKATVVKNDNFLHICRWKPVSRLHVVNNGHSFTIANQQMGYIDMVGENGFMAYYQVMQIHVHMPSEHTINGKQYHGEIHIVHAKQVTVEELDTNDLLVAAIPLEIGAQENPLLRQLLFPTNARHDILGQQEYEESDYPVDLMRALGPVIDGPFYTYNGSLTTPPCTEGVKWMVFETPQSMSAEQWVYFKKYFANPANNRPIQPLGERRLARNSLQVPGEEAELKMWDYFGGREYGHDARDPGEGWIFLPVIVAFIFCIVAFFATTPSEDPKRRAEAAGGLSEMIGRSSYSPIKD
eukprot:TRINITY_DN18557_c0_g1_i1.p1 TRINITY_DN18557_c0_g1~~TRINITY_DN18557_c0_g1_i1.p1  ORF type:complete len:970 (-),score=213.34 TRINITY_DN18557_c0_g1_i1:61-2871(-)